MEPHAVELAQFLVKRLSEIPPPTRLLVGIAGVPASGKSTLALLIAHHTARLLARASTAPGATATPTDDAVVLVGLDGWHMTRAALDALPDPKRAHDRRGAHWTFDAPSYLAFVRALRTQPHPDAVVRAPSFDHALKDPTPDAVEIHPHHRIVLIEGLYTFLDADIWREAGALLDERWWVDVDAAEAQKRLVVRHVQTGVAGDMEEAIWRAEQNDGPNGQYIMDHLLEPTWRIKSVDDPTVSTLPASA